MIWPCPNVEHSTTYHPINITPTLHVGCSGCLTTSCFVSDRHPTLRAAPICGGAKACNQCYKTMTLCGRHPFVVGGVKRHRHPLVSPLWFVLADGTHLWGVKRLLWQDQSWVRQFLSNDNIHSTSGLCGTARQPSCTCSADCAVTHQPQCFGCV